MKKIKFLLMLLIGVVMSFAFVSCGDDDDDDNNNNSGQYAGSPIVGTWIRTYEVVDNGKHLFSETYTFKADGTFTYVSGYEEGEPHTYKKSGTFLYDKDSKNLTLVITNATRDKIIGAHISYTVDIVANEYIVIKSTYDSEKYFKK